MNFEIKLGKINTKILNSLIIVREIYFYAKKMKNKGISDVTHTDEGIVTSLEAESIITESFGTQK